MPDKPASEIPPLTTTHEVWIWVGSRWVSHVSFDKLSKAKHEAAQLKHYKAMVVRCERSVME
jgi:hypothetical protein